MKHETFSWLILATALTEIAKEHALLKDKDAEVVVANLITQASMSYHVNGIEGIVKELNSTLLKDYLVPEELMAQSVEGEN